MRPLVPQTLRTVAPQHRNVVRMITRKVSDLRHYPEGTDKVAARAIRAKEKRAARKAHERMRGVPKGFGDRPNLGIFPAGSPQRNEAERAAREAYLFPDDNSRIAHDASLRFHCILKGGEADHLIYVLRARYIEREVAFAQNEPVFLSDDIPYLYNNLIDEILLCDSLYYADDPQPRIADAEYDELIMHLLELERTFPELVTPRSPSQNVAHGAAARAAKLGLDDELQDGQCSSLRSSLEMVSTSTKLFPQHKHKALMLSLDNAYNHEDLVAFIRRATLANTEISAELKIDGVALSLEYREGQLVLAATRGTGRIGDNVTENVVEALKGRGLITEIADADAPQWMIIRGEVYISPVDFAEINKDLDKPLSNPRNAAAGALKHKDKMETKMRRLQFIPYECLTASMEEVEAIEQDDHHDVVPVRNAFPTQEETLQALQRWGFAEMPRSKTCRSLEEVETFAQAVELEREQLPMEVDGIVFKYASSTAREAAGHTAKSPRGAIAYKFTAQTRVTRVTDVVMQVSRTGNVTPVAVLEPVRVGGAVMSRATLHNFDEIARLGVAVGDMVRIERGGDVIPKVVLVERKSDEVERRQIAPPDNCPSCGGEIATKIEHENGVTSYVCQNKDNCSAQSLGRLVHFSGREAMEINGLGRKTCEKLVNSGLVVLLADLFRLTQDDLLSVEGFADLSASNLVREISVAATSRSLERLIIGIGLPGVGKVGARALARQVESLDGLMAIGQDDKGSETLMGVANMAEKTAAGVYKFLRSERVITELKALSALVSAERVVDEEDERMVVKEVGNISGMSFAFTGKFNGFSRPAAMQWIKDSGGKIVADVSKKTDFVVTGVDPGHKLFKAQRLKVTVVAETDFFQFFGIAADVQEKLKVTPKKSKAKKGKGKGKVQ